ncbi:MAG TPA: AI-2E family transporter [Chitinophagaceae bacterium]|nr:AI-2E family transporter [Chitinophagaceae bacterium]
MEQLSKINRSLLFFVLVTLVLYYGKPLLIPFTLAILLAMLMAPLCKKLDNRGWHRAFSSAACTFIVLVFFLLAIGILAAQVASFVRDISLIEQRTSELFASVQDFIAKRFGIPVEKQSAFITDNASSDELLQPYLKKVFGISIRTFAGLVFTIILMFLFLYHKERYRKFFMRYVPGATNEEKAKTLESISLVSQRYLVGRAFSIVGLFILYAIALIVIGINNALLLAGVAALFNIVPVVGPVVAAIFPFVVALVTEPGYQPAIWVLVSFCLFQLLDNYYLTPHFLGGEVNLSALATIVVMVSGGLIWGIAGMILFIPIFSVAKIIFDHVPELQHYGFLIGNAGKRPSTKMGELFRKFFPKTNDKKIQNL